MTAPQRPRTDLSWCPTCREAEAATLAAPAGLREALRAIVDLTPVGHGHAFGSAKPPYLEWSKVSAIAFAALEAAPRSPDEDEDEFAASAAQTERDARIFQQGYDTAKAEAAPRSPEPNPCTCAFGPGKYHVEGCPALVSPETPEAAPADPAGQGLDTRTIEKALRMMTSEDLIPAVRVVYSGSRRQFAEQLAARLSPEVPRP